MTTKGDDQKTPSDTASMKTDETTPEDDENDDQVMETYDIGNRHGRNPQSKWKGNYSLEQK